MAKKLLPFLLLAVLWSCATDPARETVPLFDGLGTYSLEAYRMLLVVLLASAVLALVCAFFIKETFDQ